MAPKPKPTIRNGRLVADLVEAAEGDEDAATRRAGDRATTRKPETAPPRIATWTASTRLRRAAAAVRRFALTAMYMPMMPDAIEQAAPTRKATPVLMPSSSAEDVGVGDLLRLDDAR